MQIRPRNFFLSLAAALLAGGAIVGGLLYRPAADQTKFEQVYELLEHHYVTPIDEAKAMEAAINGVIKSLDDPYTAYMGPEGTQRLMESLSSSFEGIGVEIRSEDGYLVIVSPFAGSPGEKAGLRPGDRILEVNGVNLVGMDSNEAVTHVRGPKGTEARLLVARTGVEHPFEVVVIRDTIPVQTVWSEMLPDQIGLIRIGRESEPTAAEFAKALQALKAQGMKGLVLDLRQNPGGLVNQALEIAEHFVPKDKVIFQEKYRDGQTQAHRSKGQAMDLPVVVLIDEGSASAAEILAGALKESAGIPLVGVTTFGKGTVQSVHTFPDNSTLRYTVAEWLTPNGHAINKQGIQPDVEVKLPEYAQLPYVQLQREYRLGDQDEALITVQKLLEALGYTPGRTDGRIDEATVKAVQAFQTANGLPVTGTVNQPLVQKAVLLLNQKLKENDPQKARALDLLREMIQKR